MELDTAHMSWLAKLTKSSWPVLKRQDAMAEGEGLIPYCMPQTLTRSKVDKLPVKRSLLAPPTFVLELKQQNAMGLRQCGRADTDSSEVHPTRKCDDRA